MDVTVDFHYSVAMNVNAIKNDFLNGITWGKVLLLFCFDFETWPSCLSLAVLGSTHMCTPGTAPSDLLLHVS